MSSKIEWTQKTWNPITGCTKISAGCKFCYAENMTRRLKAMGIAKYQDGFGKVVIHPDSLLEPRRIQQPTTVFVCSMSDLFHEDVEDNFRDDIFDVIRATPRHTFLLLTKRASIMAEYISELSLNDYLPENIICGVTIENKKRLARLDRIEHLEPRKFLSIEPLLEDLGKVSFRQFDVVIVGGESGNNARPMKKEWVLNIKEQCDEQGVPFFFKQWGTWGEDGIKRSKKANGALLDGKLYQEMPFGV